MFGKKQQGSKPQSRIDSLIGSGTRIEGNVTFSGGLRVDGEIKGNVCAEKGADSTLVISEQARIEGQIDVAHVVINGTVVGPYAHRNRWNFSPMQESQGMLNTISWKCSRVRLFRAVLFTRRMPVP